MGILALPLIWSGKKISESNYLSNHWLVQNLNFRSNVVNLLPENERSIKKRLVHAFDLSDSREYKLMKNYKNYKNYKMYKLMTSPDVKKALGKKLVNRFVELSDGKKENKCILSVFKKEIRNRKNAFAAIDSYISSLSNTEFSSMFKKVQFISVGSNKENQLVSIIKHVFIKEKIARSLPNEKIITDKDIDFEDKKIQGEGGINKIYKTKLDGKYYSVKYVDLALMHNQYGSAARAIGREKKLFEGTFRVNWGVQKVANLLGSVYTEKIAGMKFAYIDHPERSEQKKFPFKRLAVLSERLDNKEEDFLNQAVTENKSSLKKLYKKFSKALTKILNYAKKNEEIKIKEYNKISVPIIDKLRLIILSNSITANDKRDYIGYYNKFEESKKTDYYKMDVQRETFMGVLISDADRHDGNKIRTTIKKDNKVYPVEKSIDFDISFDLKEINTKAKITKLQNKEGAHLKKLPVKGVYSCVVEPFEKLTEQELHKELSPVLSEKAVNSCVQRLGIIKKHIERLRKNGRVISKPKEWGFATSSKSD